jgi:hypothetical protein
MVIEVLDLRGTAHGMRIAARSERNGDIHSIDQEKENSVFTLEN